MTSIYSSSRPTWAGRSMRMAIAALLAGLPMEANAAEICRSTAISLFLDGEEVIQVVEECWEVSGNDHPGGVVLAPSGSGSRPGSVSRNTNGGARRRAQSISRGIDYMECLDPDTNARDREDCMKCIQEVFQNRVTLYCDLDNSIAKWFCIKTEMAYAAWTSLSGPDDPIIETLRPGPP